MIASLIRSCLLAALLCSPSLAAQPPPNVLLILADDLGAHDLGCFGSRFYETPHLDALAKRGTRLTRAYSASPLCSPTRSSIMTGMHPARTGITAPACHLPAVQLDKALVKGNTRIHVANSVTRLKTQYHTLAEALRDAGYRTAHYGKWHLGHNLQPGDAYEPRDQGFEVDWPHTPKAPGPGGGYLAPWSKFISDPAIQDQPGRHVDERMADEAGAFIRQSGDKPFFVNFWLFSVHSPWNARQDYLEHFKARVDANNPQKNPLYAAMVKSMDDAVGRLLKHLDESGKSNNTLIIFWSDNGGYAYPPKATDPAGFDHLPATSNLPLRSGKASLYEGGTREPAIVSWPGHIKADAKADFLIQSTDLYPTLLKLCSAKAKADQPCDGIDQSQALLGGTGQRDFVYCHFPHGEAARDSVMDGFYAGSYLQEGNLKLIRFYGRAADGQDELELYDLQRDPGERHNLSQQRPEDAARLNARLSEKLRQTQALLPRFNPEFGKVSGSKGKGGKAGKPMAADDLPGGWKNRAGAASLRDGALQVQAKGAQSFLGLGAGLPAGTSHFSFRIRAPQAGEGRVTLLQAAGSRELLSLPYRVSGELMWQEIALPLPLKEAAGILRLYLPSGSASVELDDLQLKAASGGARRWSFDP